MIELCCEYLSERCIWLMFLSCHVRISKWINTLQLYSGSCVYPWNSVITTVEMSRKILIKIWLSLKLEKLQAMWICFSLAKQSLIYDSLTDQKWILKKISFHFTLPIFQALFKSWINNKLKVVLVIFTSYFLTYSTVLNYTVAHCSCL